MPDTDIPKFAAILGELLRIERIAFRSEPERDETLAEGTREAVKSMLLALSRRFDNQP